MESATDSLLLSDDILEIDGLEYDVGSAGAIESAQAEENQAALSGQGALSARSNPTNIGRGSLFRLRLPEPDA